MNASADMAALVGYDAPPRWTSKQFSDVIYITRAMTGWEFEALTRVLKMEHLAPNWDGYGSQPVARRVVDSAIALVRHIAALGADRAPVPFVGPMAEGGISVEWTSGPRELTLMVHPEGVVEYLQWESSQGFEEGELTSLRLSELIGWLSGSP